MSNFQIGVIEDRNDPEKLGRVRVRIINMHNPDRVVEIEIKSMPWAYVMQPTNDSTAGASVPQMVEGTWVVVMFMDNNFQDPIVIGTLPVSMEKEPDYGKGFSDPFAVFPRWTGSDSSLSLVDDERWVEHPTYSARRDHHRHLIQQAQKKDVPHTVPGSTKETPRPSWNEPDLRGEQCSSYPYNSVREYEAGMIEEYDSTSDHTRITQMHQSGTYDEIVDDGSRTIKIVGDSYSLTLKDKKMYVEGDLSMTVEGDMRQLVKGDYVLEVSGQKHEYVGGNRESKIDGSEAVEVTGNHATAILGEHALHCGKNQTIIVDKDYIREVANNSNRTIGANEDNSIGAQHTTICGANLIEQAANIYMN